MFGKTGAGKSLLGGVLLDDYEKFVVSQNTSSATKKTSSFVNSDQNCKIFDTKGFLDTADEIKSQKDGGNPQTMVLAALETVGCIAEEGVHAVLLVLKLDRISHAEGEFAEKTLLRLFGHNFQEKMLLIITNCEENLVDEPEEGKTWLEENSKDAGSNFKKFFALVSGDPKKVIFVNNKNPATVRKNRKESCLVDNQEMAVKIFDVIQNSECFEKRAYLSENIMAFRKLLEEEAKKAKEMKDRENDLKKELAEFKALIEKQQTISAEDKKKMEKLESKLDETQSRYMDMLFSMQDTFMGLKNAALGDKGLGAIPVKLGKFGENVGKAAGAAVDVVGSVLSKLKFW